MTAVMIADVPSSDGIGSDSGVVSRGTSALKLRRSSAITSRSASVSPPVAAVDHHGGGVLAALEVLDGLQRLRRLGVAGQERGGLVLLGVGVLLRQARADDDEDDAEPRGGHEPLRAPARREVRSFDMGPFPRRRVPGSQPELKFR